MIFYCDLQGNLKAFQNETVYQGSNNVTTIYVVAPFSRPVGLNISFTKPNKLVTSPAIMKWVGTLGNVKIPVSFVNIPEQFTDTYNVWAYALPYSITEQNGVVGVSVNAVIADSVDANGQQAYKGNLTTFTGQFTVAYSALPSPPTDIPTEWTQDKVLDLLNNYYNDAIQKIGEMNTLKTDVKDTLVKAINEVFDEIASTNATIGNLSTLTTDEKTTIVGAINEVDAHADNAQQTADNATTLANTGISIAEQAQTTANNAVATANGAKTIAEQAKTIATNSVYSVSFEDIQSAVTALNGYDNAYFKVGNSIYLKQKDVPDMWVYAVASEYIEYTYTTDDDFVNALLLGTVQVGYYVLANLESTGDYDVLKDIPIINQDLSADGFTPVENTYYRHTGTTSETYTAGVVYFYNGTDYKAIDGAGGEIPTSLPQEASALKSGSLPTTGWGEIIVQNLLTKDISVKKAVTLTETNKRYSQTIDAKYFGVLQGWKIGLLGTNGKDVYVYDALATMVTVGNEEYTQISYKASTGHKYNIYLDKQGNIFYAGHGSGGEAVYFTKLSNSTVALHTYTISDTSITANSDILMELTDEGGVKANALANGSITVIRDTVPTQPIPYTYKVKQTNASGQFTVINHYTPSIPESPTSLPVTYKKVSGELPTSGWGDTAAPLLVSGEKTIGSDFVDIGNIGENNAALQSGWKVTTNGKINNTYIQGASQSSPYIDIISSTGYFSLALFSNHNQDFGIRIYTDGSVRIFAKQPGNYNITIYNTNNVSKTYTISDTDITANTSVKMYLTDEGGVKAQSKASGSITVIRDSVPTSAIPYEYEVEETSAEGLFEVINAYVPTKTSELTNDSGFITAADIGNALYPVGSIYMSVNNTNPSTFFGGTWEAWGAGKVPVGVDTADTDFATVEKTGGEKTHTLTESEMPKHSHGLPTFYSNPEKENITFANSAFNEDKASDGNVSNGGQVISAGGGQAHNNLQPYITCYMWKRIN